MSSSLMTSQPSLDTTLEMRLSCNFLKSKEYIHGRQERTAALSYKVPEHRPFPLGAHGRKCSPLKLSTVVALGSV